MFGFHPANLALRFVLEMMALVAMGVGAYNLASGPFAWALAVGVPLVAAVVWGVFNVPGDESRSGEAPVAVSGLIRLALELAFFAVAVMLLWPVAPPLATVLGAVVIVHYLLSIDRIRWLAGH